MSNDKKLSTLPLDNAMKELLDLFNQCDDKPSHLNQQSMNASHGHDVLKSSDSRKDPIAEYIDKTSQTKQHERTTAFQKSSSQTSRAFGASNLDGSETIEKIQQRQSELQTQLDEVMKVAKELEQKQKKKLNGLVQGNGSGQQSESDDGDDDIELIEFHQIEIELRISELNRQLSNIQEELRLRLYKRLQSKTSGVHTSSSVESQQPSSKINQRDPSRRNSTQTDESTPPSSSCSDETTATSTADMITHSSTKNSIDLELANQFDRCNLSKPAEEFSFQDSHLVKYKHDDLVDGKELHQSHIVNSTTPKADDKNKEAEKIDLQLAFDQSHNYEVISPSTSSNQKKSNNIPFRTPSRIPTMSNALKNLNNNDYVNQTPQRSLANEVDAGGADGQTPSNGYRSCPANNDLERIEEGEEDDFDYYCNSQRFRSIYEEKISPMIQATGTADGRSVRENRQQNHTTALTKNEQAIKPSKESKDEDKTSNYASPKPSQDNRFNIANVNSAKRGNRPLTIYLPRPDEDLDLVDTIQSLGHDLDILSSDLRITPTSAQGYIYKSCSTNSKKWLKRYFHFNRESKILSYYENEEQLVKKINSPKCTIPFEEISDVYVDHRMSEKQKGATRKSYVFVLATVKRKYLLASSKAETMRAWIDILFTAAKANDYFQQMGNDDESLSFNYDSFREN